MNFFGHAYFALERDPDPGFAFGAMLPDLVGMARVAPPEVASPTIRAGRRYHVATDRAFHALPLFHELVTHGRELWTDRGLRRGVARGAAHVAVELALDGRLAASASRVEDYRRALRHGRREFRGPLGDLLDRLHAGPLPEAYADSEVVAERVAGVLGRRPRLALDDAGRRALHEAMPAFVALVADAAEPIATSLRGALRRPPESRDQALTDAGRTSGAASPGKGRP